MRENHKQSHRLFASSDLKVQVLQGTSLVLAGP